RSGDQFYPYRQGSDFFYLSGINQDGSALVLSPGHPDPLFREILFIRDSDPKTELWSGSQLSRDQAAALSGISQVRLMEEMDSIVKKMIPRIKIAYLEHSDNGTASSHLRTSRKVLYDKLTTQYPELGISPLSPLMIRLRMVKEYEELEEIRKAAAITRSAFLRVLDTLKPGMREYEVEAELTAEFIRRGAEGHAYETIVACGKNALTLHYVANNGLCEDGALLLMDFGADVNNYAADCSRTVPVNGKFSKRQRQVYDAVVRVFKQAREMMQPGIIMADFHSGIGLLWEEEHIGLGLYSREEADTATPSDPLWKKYFMHGTSHSLGLDVHDPFDRSVPFHPGMVLTCEPAIYIPEEGLGIRLENDMLITENGAVDLMEDIPLEAEEIEEFMQRER
ncbi:MAG: aminopeptidase P N-terminal domain-containing protein, partial [Bacteroidales bacterium]|nr:aminopeptidase P N-terminal domain-containing protein [Bacteroidales bacterium]